MFKADRSVKRTMFSLYARFPLFVPKGRVFYDRDELYELSLPYQVSL